LRFVAACDVSLGAAESWAARHQVAATYSEAESMIREEALDGVVVATWPSAHCESILGALAAGVQNVLCEKPLTLTGGDAVKVWETAHDAGAFVTEGYMYRHHPATHQFADLISSGAIGTLDSVRGIFTAPFRGSQRGNSVGWRFQKGFGGDVHYEWACYIVNACAYLCGSLPVCVSAVGFLGETSGLYERLYGTVEYANGCVGIVECSRHVGWRHDFEASGMSGSLRMPMALSANENTDIQHEVRGSRSEYERKLHPAPMVDPYQCQLENFAQVILGEAQPRVPLIDSIVTVATLEALMIAVVERRLVDVALPDWVRRSPEPPVPSGVSVR